MLAVRNAAASAPAITINPQTNGVPGRNVVALGLTAPAQSLVAFLAHNWDLYSGTIAPPDGTTPTFTERFQSTNNLLYLATGPIAEETATGDKTQLDANVSNSFPRTGVLLAFSPVAANAVFNPLTGRGGGAAQPLA